VSALCAIRSPCSAVPFAERRSRTWRRWPMTRTRRSAGRYEPSVRREGWLGPEGRRIAGPWGVAAAAAGCGSSSSSVHSGGSPSSPASTVAPATSGTTTGSPSTTPTTARSSGGYGY
jgi:hypothetical protein